MKKFKMISAISILALSIGSAGTLGAISQLEADKLGGSEFTPVGAERKGNAEGTIPEWTGKLPDVPANWKDGMKLIDPYSEDKPLFYITAKNHQEYQSKLSPGQIAMLMRYQSTFRMPVYESRRPAIYPQSVYEDIKNGATRSELVGGGNGLKQFTSNAPFPMPKNGIEVIWNHMVRYRGTNSVRRTYTQIPVQANGSFSPVLFEETASWGRDMFGEDTNINLLFLQKILWPPRLEGEVLLVRETLDQIREPRQAWIFNAGQRRVRRAPNVAYDGPGIASDGLRTADDLDLFNGSPDRYNWVLKGKKEIYIPYNSFKLSSGDLKYKDIIMAGHMNPKYLRYELHRVWEIEATLREGERHIYARRTFYVDEDTWQIAIADQYDGRGELWRVKEAHAINHYGKNVPWYATEVQFDLISGRYLTTGLDNELKGNQFIFEFPTKESDYTPAALRRSSRR